MREEKLSFLLCEAMHVGRITIIDLISPPIRSHKPKKSVERTLANVCFQETPEDQWNFIFLLYSKYREPNQSWAKYSTVDQPTPSYPFLFLSFTWFVFISVAFFKEGTRLNTTSAEHCIATHSVTWANKKYSKWAGVNVWDSDALCVFKTIMKFLGHLVSI